MSEIDPAPAILTGEAARASYAPVLPLLDRLRAAGHEAWLVGGGVRDLLLGRDPGDWDVTTSALPRTVTELWPETIPTGLEHGTVTALVAGHPVEVTTFRSEGPYSDRRRPDWVRFDTSLARDLARRDFTINALALDPHGDRLADPHGGRRDLGARLLRTVGDPDARFAEDALRPLRGARFAAVLEFDLDPATRAAMARAAPSLAGVATERVRVELMKLLQARRPAAGVELLRSTGMLAVVIPELLEGVGMAQNRHHAYTVYEHTLRVLDAAPADRPRVRLAALLHDVGKPRTRSFSRGDASFHDHQNVGAAMARAVLERLRFARREIEAVAHLVEQHLVHYTPDWTEAAVRRFLRRVGPEHVDDLLALREADAVGHGGKPPAAEPDPFRRRLAEVLQREDALEVGDLAVGGRDLMRALDLEPGPEVGRVLRALLDRVIEDPDLNRADLLVEIARKIHPSP